MSNASMALLKGLPSKVAGATAKPAPVPAPEEVKVDIDSMDEAGIAGLVAEHEIETPDGWAALPLQHKKDWLNEQFGEPAGAAVAAEGVTAAAGPSAAPPSAAPPGAEPPEAAEPAKPVKEPKAAKGKAVAKDSPKSGEVLPPDLISVVSGELENLKEAEARKLVAELREGSDFNFFKMGGVLSVIQSNNWIDPHGSFKDFVEAEHGINYRRAMYWIGIYNGLVGSQIPWDAVKSVGWTKLSHIVPVLTKDNVKQWVKTAEKQSTLQLIETVKQHLVAEQQKQLGADGAAQPSLPVSTKTFKVHADQKKTIDEALGRAKSQGNTAYDTVALEMICLDYLGGTGTGATVSGQLQKLGLDEALKAFEAAFPNVSLTAEVDAHTAAAA